LSEDSQTTGTTRTLAFRCPADLESLLTKTAENLGISVSRAIDGLLREGIDARASAQIARRLEGAVARLEFQTHRQGGRNRFDDESTLLGFALLEFERGEQHLMGMLNAEVFADPIHRSAWRTLTYLGSAPRQETDLPAVLERMCHETNAAAEVAAIVGSLKAYFELIMKRARFHKRVHAGKTTVADAIRGVVGEAVQQFLAPDRHYANDLAKAREISLVKIVRDGGGPPEESGFEYVAGHPRMKRRSRKIVKPTTPKKPPTA
jgi:hypothetical protein